jgi:methionine-rich copper-binding protein CopC
MRVAIRASGLAAALLLAAAGASAHAFLDHADPRVGSTIKMPPAQVRLWFTQELEPAFSTMRVMDGAGKQVDKQDVKVNPGKPDLLTVSVPSLGPGTYKVVWRVLSVDTHVTEGDFTFKVAP